MDIPSKEELKQKYNLTSEDFNILTSTPPEGDIYNQGFLESAESFSGVPTFFWKTWGGRIIAIIILYTFTPDWEDFSKTVTVYAASQFYSYLQSRDPEFPPSGSIMFLPETIQIQDSMPIYQLGQLPVGSGIYPATRQFPSGQYS